MRICKPLPTVFTCRKMVVPCRSVNRKKPFSTTTNRNKQERPNGHGPQDTLRPIPFDASRQMYTCPIPNYKTCKYKYNIVKHLKSCYEISKKKKSLADNKVYDVCKKTFAKKSNHDRHNRQFHGSQFQISDEVSDEITTDYDELNNDVPTMVTPPRFFL